jgi:hypothetical protein
MRIIGNGCTMSGKNNKPRKIAGERHGAQNSSGHSRAVFKAKRVGNLRWWCCRNMSASSAQSITHQLADIDRPARFDKSEGGYRRQFETAPGPDRPRLVTRSKVSFVILCIAAPAMQTRVEQNRQAVLGNIRSKIMMRGGKTEKSGKADSFNIRALRLECAPENFRAHVDAKCHLQCRPR